jgi:tetratricopeptide (TPR) repeat protein
MTMTKNRWTKFPYPDPSYSYAGAALKRAWPRLHRGDAEPWPADAAVEDAWRAYHAGEFGLAVERGLAAGPAGANAANKAAMIHANYLESDPARKLAAFLDIATRCEDLQKANAKNANAWYIHAYALGRYSQGISIAKALAQGLGGKVKASLDRAIALQPKHADAHIALGTWHAEIIDKVGAMVGGLTYGAKKDAAVEHFRKALELNPDSAIARTEYANGLAMMFGNARLTEAEKLYAEAAALVAADAMERLDVEAAKAEAEDA